MVWATACGRIGFDDLISSSGAADAHTPGPGDGATLGSAGDDAGSSPGDASVLAGSGVGTCANPIVIAYGQTLSNLSIAGATDDFNVGCGAGVDSVFQITLPGDVTRAAFRVDADFAGNLDGFGDACPIPPPAGACGQFPAHSGSTISRPLTAGTHYLVVQKQSGTGVTFSFSSM